jgi:uncharacterized phosphatase
MVEHPDAVTWVGWIRHGETDWNREGRLQGRQDVPLNDAGRQQAEALGRHLASGHWDVVIASPLSRALDTARIVGRHVGLEAIQIWPDIVERDYGAASGMTLADRTRRFPDGEVPGTETLASVRSRAQGALDRVRSHHPGRRVLVVSHGGLINAVLALLSDGRLGTGRTRLDNASVSLTRHQRGQWELVSWNETPTGWTQSR